MFWQVRQLAETSLERFNISDKRRALFPNPTKSAYGAVLWVFLAVVLLSCLRAIKLRVAMRIMRYAIEGCFSRERVTCILSVLMFFVAVPLSVQAQAYIKVEGEIELVSYQARDTNGNQTQRRRVYPFKCTVGSDQWRIENEFPKNAKEVWQFDGTNVYRSIQVTKRLDIAQRPGYPALAPFDQAKSNLTVSVMPSPYGHPLGDLGVNIPWLAFCSASYLKSGQAMPLPTDVIPYKADSFAYSNRIRMFDDGYGLPQAMDLMTCRSCYTNSLVDVRLMRTERLQQAIVQGPPSFEDGIVKFHYEVTKSTNVFGRDIPIQFEYIDYKPDSTNIWREYVGGKGKVSSITSASAIEKFSLTQRATFVDYRFKQRTSRMDAIIYTNLTISETNDPRLQSIFSENLKMAKAARPRIALTTKRSLLKIILISVLVAPPLIFLFTRIAQKQNKKTEII